MSDPLAGVNIGDSFMGGYYAGIIDTTKGNIIAGDASQTGKRYALIVAPLSLEPTSALQYKTTSAAPPAAASTRWDGLTATTAMNSSIYPAAQYCAGLSYDSDGASAWYLPAMDELELIYRNLKPSTTANSTSSESYLPFPPGTQSSGYNPSSSPAGSAYTASAPSQTSVTAFRSGGAQALLASAYWSATAGASNSNWIEIFDTYQGNGPGYQQAYAYTGSYPVRPVRRLALPTAPAQATLASPASGQVLDATNGVIFGPVYHSTDGQDCNAYTLRLKTGTGSYQYWKASDSTWSSTEVWNTLGTTVPDGGTISITVPNSASLTNGNSYNWSVNTQESGANLQGTYASDSTFTARTPPAVDITSPAPGATITDTSTPAAEWTAVLAAGTVQTQYRVVWEAGSYGTTPGSGTSVSDTGVIPGAVGTTKPTALPNGNYRMFVQIWETGGESSDWEYVDFTLTLGAPDQTLTATAGTDATTGAPTVTLTATIANATPWTVDVTTVHFEACYDGSTWVDVRDAATGSLATAVAVDGAGVASVVDAEALFGGATSYRISATGADTNGTVVGAWSDTATATLDVPKCWLVDPLDLSTALHVPVRTDDTRTRTITQDVTATLGSAEPVISSDVRQLQTGSLTWSCPDRATRDALEALLTNGRTLLQRAPAEQDDPGMHVYFRPTGDLTTDRLAQSPIPVRLVRTGWAQRSRPS